MDEATKQEIRRELREANIGPSLWSLSLPKLGDTGRNLRSIVDGDDFRNDVDAGVNYVIAGEPSRIDVFAALAKEATIYKTRSYFVGIKQMLNMLQYDDRVEQLYNPDVLFIKDFYEHDLPYPFQGYDRLHLEEVINYRVDEGKPVFICTSVPLKDVKWWSSTLLHRIGSNSREFYVGKVNRRG